MTDDVIEQAAEVAHDAVCGCGDLRTHNVEDYPINVSFGVVARALAAADLLAAPSAPSVHQRWRDTMRGQFRTAIHDGFCGCRHEHDNPNHTITTGSTDRTVDAVMAIVDPILAERDEARRELAAHVAMHHEHVQRGHQWMRRAETAEAELAAANAKLGPDEPTPSDLQVAPRLGATGTAGVRLMREGIERSRADAAAPSPPVDRETLLQVGAIALNGGDERHALDRWGEMVGCVLDALASAGVVAQQHVPTKPAESLEGAGHAPTELDGVALIAAERCRQVEAEGWTAEHDNQHISGELGYAAACYAMPDAVRWFDSWLPDSPSGETVHYHGLWPWHPTWWKPTPDDRVRELVKAGALIAADIDRLLRARDSSRAAGQP